jgi:putative adhesin
MRLRHALTFAVALLAAQVSAHAQTAAGSDRIVVPLSSPDKPAELSVSLINGGITVEAYPGKEIILYTSPGEAEDGDEHDSDSKPRAANGMRRLPNASVGLVVEEENNQVRVESSSWNRANNLRLQVPVNTSLKLSCVNDGDISVRGVVGEHELQNVNGGIEIIDAQGSVVASTTNGDVKVVLSRIDGGKAMAFSSFNGDVDVTLPAAAKAIVRLRSDQGEIFSDFDVAIDRNPPQVHEERSGSRYRIEVQQELRGTIGGGGPEFLFKTFNGDIYLRKK